MNKKRRVPRIRFPGFEEDWEEKTVAEITAFHKQGFYTTEEYDETKKYYLLRGTDLSENKLILKDTPKINATEKDYEAFRTRVGDFLIVRSGTIGTYGIVYEDIPAIFGSYLINFRFDKKRVTNEFFGYFYQSDVFMNQLRQIIQQSANTNINAENIKSTMICLPTLEEQEQIGRYINEIDNFIYSCQNELNMWREFKKGMLQKLFPKTGECVPEIRFPGFDGVWIKRKLDEVAMYRNGKAHEQEISENGKYVVVNSKFVSSNGIVRKYSEKQIEPMYKNEIAFVLSDVPNGKAIARTYLIDKDDTYTLNQRVAGITPLYGVDPYFLYASMNRSPYFLKFDDGVKQTNLSIADVLGFEQCYPSYEEQRLVGELLHFIDQYVMINQEELYQWNKLKKGLLQQMFVA